MRPLALLLPLILAAPALAEEAAPPEPAMLSVTGQGDASAAPDMAIIRLGVQSEGETPSAALDQNTAAVEKVIAEIVAAGVPDKDIQTANFSVNPIYDHRRMEQEGGQPVIIGFMVSNEVVATLRDLDGMGAVLSAVVDAGANQINGLSFGIDDDAALRDEARREAMADARRIGELYAEAAGVRLERILGITEGFSISPPIPMPMMRMEAMDAASAPVPIQRGETSVSAQVSVTWEIAPAK